MEISILRSRRGISEKLHEEYRCMQHKAASNKSLTRRRGRIVVCDAPDGGRLYEPPGGNLVDCLPPALSGWVRSAMTRSGLVPSAGMDQKKSHGQVKCMRAPVSMPMRLDNVSWSVRAFALQLFSCDCAGEHVCVGACACACSCGLRVRARLRLGVRLRAFVFAYACEYA